MTERVFNVVAFVLDSQSQQVLESLKSDLTTQDIQVKKGDIEAARLWCVKQGAPDLLIVDGGDCLGLEAALRKLAEYCPPQMKLIVLGKKQEVSLYRSLMFAGVNDYHTTPLDADAIRLSLLHLQGHQVTKPLRHGRVICVLGSTGGCGASTIAANLGYFLAEKQHQFVALVDFDLFHSQHPILLGADYDPHLEHIIVDADRIDETLLAHSSQQLTKHLHLFYGQDSQLPHDDVQQPAETIQALAEHYATVIVDVPNLNHPAMPAIVEQADNCIFVTDYSLNSFRYLAKLRANTPLKHQRQILVGNLCRHAKGRVPKQEITKALGLELIVELPFDAKAFDKAEREGKPLLAERSKFSKKIHQLGQVLGAASAEQKG
ncbi:AAA family ATPase [Vibrio sp. YYF0003]|uniref:AAA family ATPase n=1 Tax=Vibrio sp. YYF0003 TaxID=3116646 RepID=UPI002EACB320|nr:AAA family ATPase [Vibrio sp. YYF0003]